MMQISPRPGGQKEECGKGKRFRRLDCYDGQGNLVAASLCGGETHLTQECRLPCPTDCRFSSWGDWGLCDTVCGPGLKNRTAKVTQVPKSGGRPCPGPTVQYAACSYPCENFQWSPGPWGQCALSKESCGTGVSAAKTLWWGYGGERCDAWKMLATNRSQSWPSFVMLRCD